MNGQDSVETEDRTNAGGERIQWIDGVRGIGCLCILLHHFFLAYFPATYYGSGTDSRMFWALDTRLADLPFFFILNGNFWVCIYLVISGFVMALKSTENIQEKRAVWYVKTAVRRYLTLVLPIFIAEMCVFAGNQIWPEFVIPDCGYALPFHQYLISTFLKTLFTCDRSVLGALWTMQAIFLGGLIVLLAKVLFRNKAVLTLVLTGAIAALFYIFRQPSDFWYFIPVFAGALLGLWYPFLKEHRSAFISAILLLAGAFLASYPSGVLPNRFFSWIPFADSFRCHLLGAFLCIYAVGTLKSVQKIFSGKIMLWLGTIAYSVYIFHPVVLKGSSVLRSWLQNYLSSYVLIAGIILIFAIVVILMIAFLYQYIIDKRWRKLWRTILK